MPRLTLSALTFSLAALALVACDKDEELEAPIPISSAAPTASVDLEVDAGAGGEAGAGGSTGRGGAGGDDTAPKATGPWDPLRISRCCAALEANRQSAPLPQRPAYDLAVSACQQARENPATIHRVRQLVPGIPACQ